MALAVGVAIVGFALFIYMVRRANRATLEAQERAQAAFEVELAARQLALTTKAEAHARAEAEARAEKAAQDDMAAQFAANRARIDHWEQHSPRQLEVARTGTPATARITGADMTDRTFGRNPLVDFTLEVQAPGGSYMVQLQFVVPLMRIPAFQPGATIEVRIDPENRENVVFIL